MLRALPLLLAREDATADDKLQKCKKFEGDKKNACVQKAKQHNALDATNQRRCAPLGGGETAQSRSGSFPKLRSSSP